MTNDAKNHCPKNEDSKVLYESKLVHILLLIDLKKGVIYDIAGRIHFRRFRGLNIISTESCLFIYLCGVTSKMQII